MRRRSLWLLGAALAAGALLYAGYRQAGSAPPAPVRYQPLRALLHVHSTYSDGDLTPAQVAAQAAGRFDVVLFADHSDLEWEYRLAVFSARASRPSLKTAGMETYLADLRGAAAAHPDLVVLPGMEASPYYYWRGIPFSPDFALCNAHKHIVVAGLERPSDFAGLPLLAYGTCRYSAYQDAGLAPYQDFLDAVDSRGGLTFWAHAGARFSEDTDQVKVVTPAHGEDLVRTRRYTGFSANDESRGLALAGGPWDQALQQYCRGERDRPAWVVIDSDFHSGRFPWSPVTVLLAAERSPQGALEAMRQGRMYTCSVSTYVLELGSFSVTNPATGEQARMGETLRSVGPAWVEAKVAGALSGGFIRLIRDGEVLRTFPGNEVSYRDRLRPGTHYYRLQVIKPARGEIFSNPIFVRVTAAKR